VIIVSIFSENDQQNQKCVIVIVILFVFYFNSWKRIIYCTISQLNPFILYLRNGTSYNITACIVGKSAMFISLQRHHIFYFYHIKCIVSQCVGIYTWLFDLTHFCIDSINRCLVIISRVNPMDFSTIDILLYVTVY
jgi:hypothetical protein